MAIKSRLLSKLKATYVSLNMAENAHPQKLHPILHRLTEAKDLCQMGLTESNYDKYGEVYDGLLMVMKQVLSGEAGNDTKGIMALCKELLRRIVLETSKEEKFKKEMVFLPYKYSMWDSLESVWRAAYEDKDNCIAYVIPIPYCDRNPDGTAKEWHCEREFFPADIPTNDWQEVDLNGMHPDVIFFHYPYDNCNSITSVDSSYYSDKLRLFTELLVYVPYFLTGQRWPEGHIGIPAYNNVDKIIIQHDQMKIQRRVFSVLRESKDRFLNEYIPQEKLVPLGSPKLDRLFYCEEHVHYPDGWEDFIAGRKVIFYNTSISGLLTHRENFINKMRYIFGVFSNRKDVVLLWRPHPLLGITLSTMVPRLKESYQKLKDVFISRKLGIYDDNPDIEMSIAVSDAYIGEGSSSVVQLFGFTGKPIFFTEEMLLWQSPTKEERSSIRCVFMRMHEDKIYFIAEGHNAFCSLNRKSREICTLCHFNDYSFNDWLYSSFIFVGEKVYFVPANARSICIYNLVDGKKKSISFESPMEWGNFIAAVHYDKYVFFIPFRYPAILRYDTETEEICYFRDCVEVIRPRSEDIHDELLCGPIVRGTKMLIPVRRSNQVLEFDMVDGSYRAFEVGPSDADCIGIVAESENVYWLVPWRTAKIRCWNYVTGECEVVDEYPEGYNCEADWFNGMDCVRFAVFCPQEGGLWLLPAYGNMILRLNYETKKLEKVDMNLPYELKHRKSNYYRQQVEFFSVAYLNAHELVLLSAFDRSLFFVNTQTLAWERQELRLSEGTLDAITPPLSDGFCRLGLDIMYASRENAACRNVNQYIDYVLSGVHDSKLQKKAYSNIAVNADGTCGEKVYKHIMDTFEKSDGRG